MKAVDYKDAADVSILKKRDAAKRISLASKQAAALGAQA
jgi:hypothetical protein